MSNYINVLKRLEGEKKLPKPAPATDPDRDRRVRVPEDAPTVNRAAAPEPLKVARVVAAVTPAVTPPVPVTPPAPVPAAAPVAAATPEATRVVPVPARPTTPIRPAAPAVAPPPRAHGAVPGDVRGVAMLYDNIRAMVSGRATRTLVFAGASTAEPTAGLTAGLARYAERQGTRPFVVDLMRREGRPLLVPRTGTGSYEIDLDGGAVPAELSAWIAEVAPTADLVILEAPPLSESIDAALLACASDGLMIVAERGVTPRATLLTAAERARVTGCRTLGVVMTGTPEPLPGWLRKIMHVAGYTSPSPAPEEP